MKKYLKMFTNSVEADIISELASAKSITITFGSWTSRIGSHGFIAVVAHWLRERLVGFEPVATVQNDESTAISTYTSQGLEILISNVLERFQLKNEVFFLEIMPLLIWQWQNEKC